MYTLSLLYGVGTVILGFITFWVRHDCKSIGNEEMVAIGTKLVVVCFVSSLFFIIWGMLG